MALKFVWITDGKGWHSASNKLEEAFLCYSQYLQPHDYKRFYCYFKVN